MNKPILIMLILLTGCAGQAPEPASSSPQSGLQKGDDIVPWNPIHVAGPNKGTNACPICTYEARPAVQMFISDQSEVPAFAARLQQLVDEHKKQEFKAFIIVLNSTPDDLKKLADDLRIQNIGLCYPDPVSRASDLKGYKINPDAKNTVILYKDYKVVANFVNLAPADFCRLDAAVNKLP